MEYSITQIHLDLLMKRGKYGDVSTNPTMDKEQIWLYGKNLLDR